MTTTTLVVGGGLGLGLGAAALAGAVGLGLAAAAAFHGGRNRGKGYHGGGGHGHGGGGGGYGGYHRRRRHSPKEGHEKSLDKLMELIREEDVSGCARRLVCELAGHDYQTLTVEELSILNLVGPAVKPGNGVLPKGASEEYREARGVGQRGGDCGQNFASCPLTGPQIMEAVMEYLP